jgi:predicted homoserine dehydrogenase-like protein
MELLQTLKRIEEANESICVGIVGLGQMGEGLVCQMETLLGMKAVAIADIIPGRAAQVYQNAHVDSALVVETNNIEKASAVVDKGRRVATENAFIISQIPAIDIVVEATGIPNIGVQVAHDAILAGKHVVQMNVEADATTGFYLRKLAESSHVVYTLSGGDEPGSIAELYDFAASLGFDVISVGKGQNNKLDRSGNPESVASLAKKRNMNPKMLASFVDGSKTMVEMTSIGNGIGFVPDIRGMHGADSTSDTIRTIFIPKEDGGILDKTKIVEFSHGIAPGVFLVFTARHPKIIRDLGYVGLGDGPYYSLYRPYHLTNMETPISIAKAVLFNATTLATTAIPTCETVAFAKQSLKVGESLDTIGGFTFYGMIEERVTAVRENLLPLGLAPGAVVRRNIKIGMPITYDDVEFPEELIIHTIRRLQDRMIKKMDAGNNSY